MTEFKYTVEQEVGVVSINPKGWRKELNLISWNDRPARYDLREWSPGRNKTGKGLTLSHQELKALKDLLDTLPL